MSDFEKAVKIVLMNEGGFVNILKDPGGITNHGISARFLMNLPKEKLQFYGIFELVSLKVMKELTLAQAISIYKHEFWNNTDIESIVNQELADYIFDMIVNFGMIPGIKLVQRAANAFSLSRNYLLEDGILGYKTIDFLNHASKELLPCLIATRLGHYEYLVGRDPNKSIFLNGWINRAFNTSGIKL